MFAVLAPRPALQPHQRRDGRGRAATSAPTTPERKRRPKSSWLARALSPRATDSADELSSSHSNEAEPVAGPSVPRRQSSRQPGSITRHVSSPGSLRSAYMLRESSSDTLDDADAGYITPPEAGPPSLHESASLNTRLATRSLSCMSPRRRDDDVVDDHQLGGRMVDVLLGPAFAEYALAGQSCPSQHDADPSDRHYAAALRVLHRLQTAADQARRPPVNSARTLRRRSVSLPSLHEAIALDAPARPRPGWAGLSAILRPSPTLPNVGPTAPLLDFGDESDEEETRAAVLAAAFDAARVARTELLVKLSIVARLAHTLHAVTLSDDGPPAYAPQLVAIALALMSRTPACLISLAPSELLELRSTAIVLTQAFERARPGADVRQVPQRGSSLPTGEDADVPTADVVGQASMVHDAFVSFDHAYAAFEACLCVRVQPMLTDTLRTRSYVEARDSRMMRRAMRREERVRMAALVLRGEDDPANAAVTVLSTFDLAQASLGRALKAGLISTGEVASLDPRCFVVLPRLCTLYGIETADLPSDWRQRPFVLLLPRICRAIPPAVVLRVRALEPRHRRDRLAATLAGFHSSPRPNEQVDEEVDALYRELAAAADRGSQGSGARAWAKLMARLLRTDGDVALAQEEIARELGLC